MRVMRMLSTRWLTRGRGWAVSTPARANISRNEVPRNLDKAYPFWDNTSISVTSGAYPSELVLCGKTLPLVRGRRCRNCVGFPLLVLQRCHRVQESPAHDAHQIDGRRYIEGQVPVVMRPEEDIANDLRTERPADVARHVHGAGKRACVGAADVHAGSPGAGHHQIVGETGQPDRQNSQQRIVHPGGEQQKHTGAGETE